MLQCYDLYDLYAIFVNIRSMPNYPLNAEILLEIIKVLKNQEEYHELNQIRKAIKPLLEGDTEKRFLFAGTENTYVYFPTPIIKDNRIYDFLIIVCENMLFAIENYSGEQISEMADCLHNLPIGIVNNKNMISKSFWKYEVKAYRNKWDKNFLLEEEKKFNGISK